MIGDTIVDQYVQCSAVGMSQEDPTIVVTPEESKFFLGGAGTVVIKDVLMGKKLLECRVTYYDSIKLIYSRNYA